MSSDEDVVIPPSWIRVNGIVCPGHQVASGRAEDSPYPAGTLALQMPFFQKLGLNLSNYFLGTLNVSIAPYIFQLIQPDYTFPHVKWIEGYAAETFSFVACQLRFQQTWYDAWIYYPHPETKIDHFQDPSIVEIIAPEIDGIQYGDSVTLTLRQGAIAIQT